VFEHIVDEVVLNKTVKNVICMKAKTSIKVFNPIAVAGIALICWAAHAQPQTEPNENVRPQFVFVEGQVKVPQRYVYTNGLTLNAAIKRAKGVTAEASPKVTLYRNGKEPLIIDRKALDQGKEKDIELKPGDKVVVAKK
jgi:hypothetical protein